MFVTQSVSIQDKNPDRAGIYRPLSMFDEDKLSNITSSLNFLTRDILRK
jgi:hypothetical protein